MAASMSGEQFKAQLRSGVPKIGLFINSASVAIAEQLAHSGYEWLLVDTQHGPMHGEKLGQLLMAISSGGAKSMVRVTSYTDRAGIQQVRLFANERRDSHSATQHPIGASQELHPTDVPPCDVCDPATTNRSLHCTEE